ncbi:MAG: InlB B-repeat-containing protein [Lachnospiraceae bacterium]|nr:InlB B-repeat-containing protein [Lachnospiraceae bacterium]
MGLIRCMSCMELFDAGCQVCPHCGSVINRTEAEAIHLQPHTILHNRYEIGNILGYGGFGTTYVAWDMKLQQKVAVKEYFPTEFCTRMPGHTEVRVFNEEKGEQFEAGLRKFTDEAIRLAKFQNEPGIVTIYDSIVENGTAYIIMEYLDGETLEERLRREGTIDEDEAIGIIIPVLESLKAVHAAGIIHRDIAPENIVLTGSGEIKLIDFSAARFATTSHSRSLTVTIKQGYSPEEQYRSRGDQGPHTDVYSIAATLYKMITGNTPPDAMERRTMFESKGKDLLVPIHKIRKKININHENAILNALNVRIEDRTPDVQTFINELMSTTKVKRKAGKIAITDLYTWPKWLKVLLPTLLGAAVVFAVLLLTGIIRFESLFSGELVIPDGVVVVPDVEGMDKNEAITLLSKANLNPVADNSIESEYIESGKIVLQTPAGDSYLKEYGIVSLTVSSGKKVAEAVDGISIVPYVIWDLQEEAAGKLQQAGLSAPDIITEYDEFIAAGRVISQSIEAGQEVEEGSRITLVVSLGAAPFEMINVVGSKEEAAKQMLHDKGLDVIVDYVNSNTDVGNVLEQSIAEGSIVRKGDTVTITVATGAELFEVPPVAGMKKKKAVSTLEKAGFTVVALENYDSETEAGCVISQSPEAGSSQEKNAVITIYVSKGAQSVKAILDPMGGECDIVELDLLEGASYGNLPVPVRKGYRFDGWFTEADEGMRISESTEVTVQYAHTLYAHWSASVVAVTLNPTGGKINGSSANAEFEVIFGEAYAFLPVPVKGSESFVGWFTSESGGQEIVSSTTVDSNGPITLYAHWASDSCRVSFDANGGYVGSSGKNVSYGSKYGTLPNAERDGYSFRGWSLSRSGGDYISENQTVESRNDHTLYAQWSVNSYTVSFNANGGYLNGDSSKTVKYMTEYGTLPTAERSGFSFAGWYTAASGGRRVRSDSVFEKAGNQTLYAQWESAAFTVTLDANGGSLSQTSIQAEYGKPYGTLPKPSKSGETFIGWFTSKSGYDEVSSDSYVYESGPHTLYAHWSVDSYKVIFDANGGYCDTKSKDLSNGSQYGSMPTPELYGYTFDGWFTDTVGGKQIISSTTVSLSSNIILYARWSPVSYWVSLDANGGYLSSGDIYVTYYEKYGSLPTPSMSGAEFLGWYNSDGSLVTSTTVVGKASAHTLTAKWKTKTYTVTLNANGGSCDISTMSVSYGEYIYLPTASRPGYTFNGWSLDGARFDSGSLYSYMEDIVLKALWQAETYCLYFDANGGTASESERLLAYGAEFGPLPSAKRDGCRFTGWYIADGITVSESNVIGNQDVYLTAGWEKLIESDWVRASEVPAGAEITAEKWTYVETVKFESSEPSYNGLAPVGSDWIYSGEGHVDYANVPGTFDSGHYLYSELSNGGVSGYEDDYSKRVVETAHGGYVYWHWMYNVAYANTTQRMISDRYGNFDQYGNSGSGFVFKYFSAFKSTADCPYLDNYYCCSRNQPSYNCSSVMPDKSSLGTGTPRYFRFEYYTAYYYDYVKVYYYNSEEKKESTKEVYEEGNISNVVKYVKYLS